MELLYRGTRDGSESKISYNKCDNKISNIYLYKSIKKYIFLEWYTSI